MEDLEQEHEESNDHSLSAKNPEDPQPLKVDFNPNQDSPHHSNDPNKGQIVSLPRLVEEVNHF